MKFEIVIYLTDNIITIHKHDETFFDIKISSYWKWVTTNALNTYNNDSFEASNLNKDEYFGLNDYETIKSHITKYISETKFIKNF